MEGSARQAGLQVDHVREHNLTSTKLDELFLKWQIIGKQLTNGGGQAHIDDLDTEIDLSKVQSNGVPTCCMQHSGNNDLRLIEAGQ